MLMQLIHQQLEVKDWPLVKLGDEKFFGYVVALGVFPFDWGVDDGMTQYADFAYNDFYARYRLPNDESLKKELHEVLWHNINGVAGAGDIYGKVWIKRLKNGYEVALP